MQIPHVANTHQIGRQLAELEQEIHSALKDIRRNLEELEEVSRMATDRASQASPKVRRRAEGVPRRESSA